MGGAGGGGFLGFGVGSGGGVGGFSSIGGVVGDFGTISSFLSARIKFQVLLFSRMYLMYLIWQYQIKIAPKWRANFFVTFIFTFVSYTIFC